jgi:hypothetical protein
MGCWRQAMAWSVTGFGTVSLVLFATTEPIPEGFADRLPSSDLAGVVDNVMQQDDFLLVKFEAVQ